MGYVVSKQSSSGGKWAIGIIVIAVVIAGGVYLMRQKAHQAEQPVQPNAPATAASAAPAIRHPISQAGSGPAGASTAPLPPLDESDASVSGELATLAGGGLRDLLVSRQVITRIVATVDALPRQGLGTSMLPVHTPKGGFLTTDADGQTVIGERNAARYAPYMRIVENVDPKTLVAWYVRDYPLFQEAYRQLGYPKGYFNDRLIEVIDNLLAAPDLSSPPALIQPKVLYVYADPSLESLSAGQKMLLRIGPANEAKLKAKLRAIRTALTGQTFPTASGSAAGPATTGSVR